MKVGIALVGSLLAAPSAVMAVSESTCAFDIACAQTELCDGPKSVASTQAHLSIDFAGTLTLNLGHREAVFDRVPEFDDGKFFAQMLPASGKRQKMLSVSPNGVIILTVHDPSGPGISITTFGTCQETLNWTS